MRKLLLLLPLILLSCSFVDDSDEEHEKESHPDIILENTAYTLGQSGEKPVYIESERMILWSGEDRAETGSISFSQKDADGSVSLEGRAESSEIDTEGKVLLLKGNVLLSASNSNMAIEAEEVKFDTKAEEVSSDGTVLVSSDDGAFKGEGFMADLINSSYTFHRLEEGTIWL